MAAMITVGLTVPSTQTISLARLSIAVDGVPPPAASKHLNFKQDAVEREPIRSGADAYRLCFEAPARWPPRKSRPSQTPPSRRTKIVQPARTA